MSCSTLATKKWSLINMVENMEIPVLGKLRWEDPELEARLGHSVTASKVNSH